jgi:hypothetical protein
MKTIQVKLIAGTWFADYEGDSEIQSLFGTTLIPTPFRTGWNGFTGQEVVEELKKHNPDASIELVR